MGSFLREISETSSFLFVSARQIGVSNADPDHGGPPGGRGERRQGAAEGQQSEGPAPGVHRGRGEEERTIHRELQLLFSCPRWDLSDFMFLFIYLTRPSCAFDVVTLNLRWLTGASGVFSLPDSSRRQHRAAGQPPARRLHGVSPGRPPTSSPCTRCASAPAARSTSPPPRAAPPARPWATSASGADLGGHTANICPGAAEVRSSNSSVVWAVRIISEASDTGGGRLKVRTHRRQGELQSEHLSGIRNISNISTTFYCSQRTRLLFFYS